jgi:trimethylamine-N-oxide reductase (cytochrome c)
MFEEKKIGAPSLLKSTGATALSAVARVSVGFGASQLLKPRAPAVSTTVAGTATPVAGEQVYLNMWKERGALRVFVKDGRVTRTEVFDPKGQLFASVFQNAERYRVYSPERIQYPMKRVGWAPGGKSPIDNRGKGEFVRITWEEAYSSIAEELRRILQTYGPSAILLGGMGHSDSWYHHTKYNFMKGFFGLLGGYTPLLTDGYSWGGSRSSGASIGGNPGVPCVFPQEEVSWFLKYSKMMVFWSRDPLLTDGAFSMGEPYAIVDDCRLFKQAGIKLVFIGASMDETSKNFADTWIPCHPYADEALAAAIAYVWITEGTYDQTYLNTHSVGFDEDHMPAGAPKGASLKNYILGLSDGVKKTPEWAEPITGVKARIIRALAREWASKPTGLMCWRGGRVHGGQYIRFMYTLLAMQGLGKPGVGPYAPRTGVPRWRDGLKVYPAPSMWGEKRFQDHTTSESPFIPNIYPVCGVAPPEFVDIQADRKGLGEARWLVPGGFSHVENKVKGYIRDVLWEVSMKASHDKPVYHRYNIGNQTGLYQYPMPGNSEVHAYFTAGGNYLAKHPNSNSTMRALLSPKFEFIVMLDPWMEADCKFADIILPTVSNFERNDISTVGLYDIYCQKCIEPLFESKSDMEIWIELSKRMGIYDKYVAGPNGKPLPTEDDWLKLEFMNSTASKYYSWEEFKRKGYHEWVVPDTWRYREPNNWNWKQFMENPSTRPFPIFNTESGLLEIYSKSSVRIASMGQSGYYLHEDPNMSDPVTQKYEKPNPGPDPLCPGIPTYIPNPEGPGTPTAQKYPIAILTSHPKFAYHVSYQNVIWLQDEERKLINGYRYAPIHISSKDAADRGIKHGDLVRVFNDRGQILCWADVSERFMPGVAHVTYGRWNDYVQPGVPGSLDKSGNVENLCRGGFISPYDTQCDVQAVAQVEKWTE